MLDARLFLIRLFAVKRWIKAPLYSIVNEIFEIVLNIFAHPFSVNNSQFCGSELLRVELACSCTCRQLNLQFDDAVRTVFFVLS